MGEQTRHALRRLRLTPGFTLAALLTLALGIGANTALFSVVHAVLLKPLPFREPEGLFAVWSRHTSTDRYPFQLPEFCDYRDLNRTLAGLGGFANWSGSLTGDGPAERLVGVRVTGDFFEILGATVAEGRALRPDDDRPGQEKVVVLSHGLWQRRFGGDPRVVGRRLALNGESFGIVGVLDRDFIPPVRAAEVFIPLAAEQDPWRRNRASTNFVRAIGRARPGVSRAQIQGDLDGIAGGLQREFPDSYARKKGVLVVPYREELTRLFERTLFVLQGAVGLLLLIACANLANLTLVRASARRRELAVRQAMGASRLQLVRPLLIESGLVAMGGALLGVLLAAWAVPTLVALLPATLPRAREIQISLPVLLFTLGAAALATLLFGLVPAFRAARSDPNEELKSDGRAAAGSADRGRLRGLAVGAQVALMTVLLTGAVLLLESFREVLRVLPGFDPGVLTVRLSLPPKDYGNLGRVSRFYREVEARVLALPGVTSVAAVNHVPLNGALASADYKVADQPPVADDQLPTANYRMVTPAYFRAMGIPVIAGRAFDEDDHEGGAAVAIASQSLVRQSLPGGRPLGRELLVKDNPEGFRPVQIVGVVGDVKHAGLEADAVPHLYVPYHQTPAPLLVWLSQNQFLVVRSSGPPLSLAEPVKRALQAVDPNVATADIRTAGHYADAAAAPRRFSLTLLAVFAALAVALASVGIYGVAAFNVAERRREAGVRIALGAQRRDILSLVLGEGLRRTLAGLALGLAGALASAHALRGLLYGVGAADPLAYAGVGLLVMAVSLLACLGPAWRAAPHRSDRGAAR